MDGKSCVTFLLCDPGWYVHKPDVQDKDNGMTIHTYGIYLYEENINVSRNVSENVSNILNNSSHFIQPRLPAIYTVPFVYKENSATLTEEEMRHMCLFHHERFRRTSQARKGTGKFQVLSSAEP